MAFLQCLSAIAAYASFSLLQWQVIDFDCHWVILIATGYITVKRKHRLCSQLEATLLRKCCMESLQIASGTAAKCIHEQQNCLCQHCIVLIHTHALKVSDDTSCCIEHHQIFSMTCPSRIIQHALPAGCHAASNR